MVFSMLQMGKENGLKRKTRALGHQELNGRAETHSMGPSSTESAGCSKEALTMKDVLEKH